MSRQVKCPICGNLNDKENTIIKNKRYYCKDCYAKLEEEKEANKSSWNLLFDYICKLYNIDKPNGFMFKQLKDYRNEPYCYTDEGMYATLKYYYETLGNTVIEGTGLGIIPYYYDKTKKHYQDMNIIEDSLNSFNLSEENKVTIDFTKRNELIKSLQKTLNYDDIDWSEE